MSHNDDHCPRWLKPARPRGNRDAYLHQVQQDREALRAHMPDGPVRQRLEGLLGASVELIYGPLREDGYVQCTCRHCQGSRFGEDGLPCQRCGGTGFGYMCV